MNDDWSGAWSDEEPTKKGKKEKFKCRLMV